MAQADSAVMTPAPAPRRRPGERDLTTGPITRTLLLFALPVLGSNLLQSINGSINAVWVGRLLGEQALAATSNANLILMLVLGAVFGIGMAATILVAQAVGRHDLVEARRVVGTGTTFFAVVSVSCAVVGWFGVDWILGLLGTPADALPLARDYLRVIFLAVPVMNLFSFLMSVLRGAGDSRTPFAFMALSVVLDIVLNPLLIAGYGPFPALGIAGSGWATLIGQLVSVTALLVVIYRRKDPLRLTGQDLALLKPDPSLVRLIVTKGVPIGMQMVVISLAALTLMGLVNQGGSRVTAAYGIAAQLWTYVQMPALAIGAAVSSMAAQNVGAGRWDRVGGITRAGIVTNLVLTSLLVAVLYLFERPVLGLFLGTDGGAVDIAIEINRWVLWSFILFGVTIVLFATVRATGAVLPPLCILVVSLLIARTGFAYAMRPALGLEALWISFAVGNVTSVVLAALYYRYGGWRKAKMLPGAAPTAATAPPIGAAAPATTAATAGIGASGIPTLGVGADAVPMASATVASGALPPEAVALDATGAGGVTGSAPGPATTVTTPSAATSTSTSTSSPTPTAAPAVTTPRATPARSRPGGSRTVTAVRVTVVSHWICDPAADDVSISGLPPDTGLGMPCEDAERPRYPAPADRGPEPPIAGPRTASA